VGLPPARRPAARRDASEPRPTRGGGSSQARLAPSDLAHQA
jgi:hypothetical protein